jgi:hypothetical protein
VLTFAYDSIEFPDDRRSVRARPNGLAAPGRFGAGWLLRLCLLQPDRLGFERTDRLLQSGRPFVYPLELTSAGRAGLLAGPRGFAADIPPAVLEAARRGRAVILVWSGDSTAPLELNAAGTVWLLDVVQLFAAQHELPGRAVWLITGAVSAFEAFDEWIRERHMYLPEAVQLHAMTVFPTFAQARLCANRRGWDVSLTRDAADGAVTLATLPFVVPEPAAEPAGGALRGWRFSCLNDGTERHRQILVSFLQAAGYLDDCLTRFGAAPIELNDGCSFPVPGAEPLQERLQRGWLALQPTLPLDVGGAAPARDSYVAIASADDIDGNPCIDDRLLAPIIDRQPFLWVGPPDSLRYLRALGFKTFGRVIDEQYDRNDTFGARMMRILGQIEGLAQRPKAALRDLYVDCLPELEHNYAHLLDGRHQLDAALRTLDARLGTA